jgi:L-lactate dehydrogenase complex protein LldG
VKGPKPVNSRDTILHRIRNALTDVPHNEQPDQTPINRDYATIHTQHTPQQTTDLLAEHLTDYRATVHRSTPAELPHHIADLLTDHGSHSLIVPTALPPQWLTQATHIEIVHDDPTLPHQHLDAIDSTLTACTVAIAETGTIVLDHTADQGHRRITLIPDHHICVVRTDQIVGSVPQALPLLDPRRPLTWISGPSATSDIELERVEGVHGPRTLDVIIVTG